eukprot:752584-Hanusia_phi.AAC.2
MATGIGETEGHRRFSSNCLPDELASGIISFMGTKHEIAHSLDLKAIKAFVKYTMYKVRACARIDTRSQLSPSTRKLSTS